jgi:hypothetical protein
MKVNHVSIINSPVASPRLHAGARSDLVIGEQLFLFGPAFGAS